jgi:hypothetical protein
LVVVGTSSAISLLLRAEYKATTTAMMKPTTATETVMTAVKFHSQFLFLLSPFVEATTLVGSLAVRVLARADGVPAVADCVPPVAV